MSSAKLEKSRAKAHMVSQDLDEECTSNSGKPCIDFQPDDRWHIKEDNERREEPNNSRKRRSARKRKSSSHRSARAKKQAVAINGEIKEEQNENDVVCEDSAERAISNKTSPKAEFTNLEAEDQPQINACASEKNSRNSPTEKCESEDLAFVVKKENLSPSSSSLCKNIRSTASVKTNGIDIDASSSDFAELKQPTSPCVRTEKLESSDSSLCTEDKDKLTAPVLKDERTKLPAVDNLKEELSAEDGIKEQTMPELSSNENSQSSFKKEDGDISIVDERLPIIKANSDGVDSDSEVQIISGVDKVGSKDTSFTDKLIEQSFSKDKSLSMEEKMLSPGFPYFNSLQEKMTDFVAGKYKPVKFPPMGTLMLEENEVIIESPSLLVPLLIKEADKIPKLCPNEGDNSTSKPKVVRRNFFQSSVGEFLVNLGGSRVLEWYYKDLKRSKLKQLHKSPSDHSLRDSICDCQNDLNLTKKANAPFSFPLKKCKFCDFKTESSLVLEGHYLIPHITPRREFRCNFCDFLCRDPKEMSFHFEAIHGKTVVSGDQATFYECLFCSFHCQLRSKLKGHMNRCRKYFLPSQNQSPPFDFEFPGVTTKPVTITDVIAHRRMLMGSSKSAYSNAAHSSNMDMSALARKKLASVLNLTGSEAFPDSPTLIKHLIGPASKPGTPGFQLPPGIVLTRPRVRASQMRQPPPNMTPRITNVRGSNPRNPSPYPSNLTSAASHLASSGISITPINKHEAASARMSVGPQGNMKNITLTPISSAGNVVSQKPGPPQPIALFTNVAGSEMSKARAGMLPMSQTGRVPLVPGSRGARLMAPYQRLNTPPSQVVKTGSGSSFVLCEICDSYIKDLEELRSHMNWVHKVKIHPKMLVSRPPLNCQKCQWRFFTDQGLERHLLGAHGLVTTNMQEMANKNQDGGRCIICGAVFTYKLVSHMTQVHKVTLKPAHLSYKCTVCTATFTLYRLFESHVYNVHSASAKRPTEESSSNSEPPAKKVAPTRKEEPKPQPLSEKKCSECDVVVDNMEKHIIEKHLKKCSVKLCRIEKCKKCLYSSKEMLVIRMSDFKGLLDSDEDSSDDDDDDDESSSSSSESSKEEDTSKSDAKASDSKESAGADA